MPKRNDYVSNVPETNDDVLPKSGGVVVNAGGILALSGFQTISILSP